MLDQTPLSSVYARSGHRSQVYRHHSQVSVYMLNQTLLLSLESVYYAIGHCSQVVQ
jgi:hypothetical protein